VKPLAHLTVELGSKLDVAELFPIVYDERRRRRRHARGRRVTTKRLRRRAKPEIAPSEADL
jgi:hypothetical protein